MIALPQQKIRLIISLTLSILSQTISANPQNNSKVQITPTTLQPPINQSASITSTSPLKRLVLSLYQQDLATQQAFATAAISELAFSYQQEIQYALEEPDNRAKNITWSNAVRHYSNQLWQQVESISSTTPIHIEFIKNKLALRIDHQLIIISGPRYSQQSLLEQHIIERFCSEFNCQKLQYTIETASPLQTARRSKLSWSFKKNGQFICKNNQGLQLLFADMQDIHNKRQFCQQLINEIDDLLINLQRFLDNGISINWQQLSIDTVAGEKRHQMRLNNYGDILWIPLPISVSQPSLIEQLRPWLRARSNKKNSTLILEIKHWQLPTNT